MAKERLVSSINESRVRESIARLQRLHKQPHLDVPLVLQEIETLADLGAGQYPKINECFLASGKILEIQQVVSVSLQMSIQERNFAEFDRHMRLCQILGIELELQEYLRNLGKRPEVWGKAFNLLNQAEDKSNIGGVRKALRLMEFLGMEEVPEVAEYVRNLRKKYGLSKTEISYVQKPPTAEEVKKWKEIVAIPQKGGWQATFAGLPPDLKEKLRTDDTYYPPDAVVDAYLWYHGISLHDAVRGQVYVDFVNSLVQSGIDPDNPDLNFGELAANFLGTRLGYFAKFGKSDLVSEPTFEVKYEDLAEELQRIVGVDLNPDILAKLYLQYLVDKAKGEEKLHV